MWKIKQMARNGPADLGPTLHAGLQLHCDQGGWNGAVRVWMPLFPRLCSVNTVRTLHPSAESGCMVNCSRMVPWSIPGDFSLTCLFLVAVPLRATVVK